MNKAFFGGLICVLASSYSFAQTSIEVLMNMKVANNIGALFPFNEANDPNKQMGRPNQYISKASWADKRIDPHDFSDENAEEIDRIDPVDFKGGTIEGFKNTADLNRRYNYIKNITLHMPIYNQYMYRKGLFLMRLDTDLTPSQAKEYEKQFNLAVK